MQQTQHDLSYDKTTLDYEALLATSQIAFHHCIEEISKYTNNLREFPKPKFCYGLSAQWLAREANHLVTVAETMETLLGGLERSELVIINKE